MLFTDPGLPQEFRDRWFSWANPAETMVVFAQWAGDNADLYALAVSTDRGGSVAPARNTGVVHVDEDSRKAVPPPRPASRDFSTTPTSTAWKP